MPAYSAGVCSDDCSDDCSGSESGVGVGSGSGVGVGSGSGSGVGVGSGSGSGVGVGSGSGSGVGVGSGSDDGVCGVVAGSEDGCVVPDVELSDLFFVFVPLFVSVLFFVSDVVFFFLSDDESLSDSSALSVSVSDADKVIPALSAFI